MNIIIYFKCFLLRLSNEIIKMSISGQVYSIKLFTRGCVGGWWWGTRLLCETKGAVMDSVDCDQNAQYVQLDPVSTLSDTVLFNLKSLNKWCFTQLSTVFTVISWRKLTLFVSLLGFTSTRLGL